MVYLTKDEYAQKQGYDTFVLYAADNEDYVTEDALDDMIEEMSALMNDEIGTDGTDITTAKYLVMLRNICYRGTVMMVDEDQARAHEEKRSLYIPRDYMFERDRERLRKIGRLTEKRILGKWVF